MRALSKDGSVRVTDESVNTITHLFATVAATLGGAHLVVQAALAGDPVLIVALAFYAVGLIGTFLSSTLHHGIDGGPRLDARLRTLDYLAIYVLIAGTYAPLCLGPLRSPFAITLLAVVALVAATGIVLRASWPPLPKWVSLTLYGAAGWLAIALVPYLIERCGLAAFGWLLLGGLFYTVGAVIFVTERPNPVPGRFGFHELWHLLVMGGAACHYVLIASVL